MSARVDARCDVWNVSKLEQPDLCSILPSEACIEQHDIASRAHPTDAERSTMLSKRMGKCVESSDWSEIEVPLLPAIIRRSMDGKTMRRRRRVMTLMMMMMGGRREEE